MQSNDVVPAWAGALAGVVAGAVALGVAQLVAGVVRPEASPVVAVGGAAVDLAPPPLKEFAISAFGENDKTVLIGGTLAVLAVLAAAVGVLALRRAAYGYAGLAVLGAVGLAAVLTRPGGTVADVLPTVVGMTAGAWALRWLVRRASGGPAAPVEDLAETRAADSPSAGSPSMDPPVAGSPSPGTPADLPVAERPVVERPAADLPSPGTPADLPVVERPAVMRAGEELRGFDRRSLLTGVAGGVVVAGASTVLGRMLAGRQAVDVARTGLALPRPATPAAPLPAGVDLGINGLTPFITKNRDFYRVDTALVVPQVDPRAWRLRIHGMVDRPIEITYAELLKMPLTEADVTLTCVSNEVGGPYAGNARWLGVRMADVLRGAGLQSGADMLLSTSDDGFTCGTPVDVVMDGRAALFAVAMNGEVLPVDHGFPVRQVVPGLYGYVSATKWVVDVKVTRFDRDEAYWTPRGWAAKGPVKTQSRIDLPKPGASLAAGPTTVAGVAWAQHTGIDAVEVRVDRGPWRQARLAQVPGPDTWRQWAFDWDAAPGSHTIEVRATDAAGRTQPEQRTPTAPDGATGWHAVTVEVA
ncbi:DMSO/TMAO reductase YedYZ molybdopterin-dependent catalytic subunit [Nonomuraea muscovyensis]|uniref:DMSO/TMAO reductase YedYZ molybdopterin-dependent catalytic subunit n=1 Tax=Nonomuraea muscovyensis TaxID=1124761 RepID=A0A7X0CBJ6_9ACTN|nr:molybdopterin-dependent oxidoreductase [Nonomuraea muscovyensis]MBB6351969.1 DMSO/TMAO reductase YedYZ molybdopterin-dependent catalytic subunit [Nonomuraea muscovyensis]